MELWYALVDLLPFEWAQPGHMFFMKNALLAVLVITPLFGLMDSEKVPFGWGKFVGLGLMLGGVVLFKWK